MKPLALAALSLLLLSGTAAASNSVPRVDAIADAVRTATLRSGLTQAVKDVCGKGIASIVVTRRGLAVDWAPALENSSAVAIALR